MEDKLLPHNHNHISKFLQNGTPKSDTFDTIAELLKIMSDSKRIQIFWLLCHCEECVINLSALLEMSSPAVSHHLKLLKTAGLIINRREGKEVYYTAAKTSRSQVLHDMIEQIVEVACPAAETFSESSAYDSHISVINEIHGLLTSDLSKRYTIEELSLMYHINQTTLKAAFKTVFGKSIAAYMKDLRIKRAMEYLSATDMPVSEISCKVGYENQSKFTQAFKSATGILPKDYRRNS